MGKAHSRSRKGVGLLGRWLAKQGPGIPVACRALLCDGVTPHGKAHTHDGAGNEDQEDHKGTDQQVQEGIEEGAAGAKRKMLREPFRVPLLVAPLDTGRGQIPGLSGEHLGA